MALAVLQLKGQNNEYYLFQADIGTARYFKYVLGEKKSKLKVTKNEHIVILSGEKKVSNLLQINEALHKINKGYFPLKIPKSETTKNIKYVQLYSYTNRTTRVPTISNIIRLYPIVGRKNIAMDTLELSLSQSIDAKNETAMQDFEVKNRAFNYREPPLSKVMFWNAIVSALPNLVKHVAPIIGGLLGSGKKTSSATPANTAANANKQSNGVIAKVLEVLQEIANAKSNGATTSPTTQQKVASKTASLSRLSSAYNLEADTLKGLEPILEKVLSPEAILAIGDEPKKLFMAVKDAVKKTEYTSGLNSDIKIERKAEPKSYNQAYYSEAKIAPALLAALPALMPAIKKALDPKLIEAVGNQPLKLFKAIGDTVLKMDAQEIQHLENINPGVDSADDIAKLLQGMSISSGLYKDDLIQFKMIKNLNLNFVNSKTVNFKNKDRILYSKKNRIVIPFTITSNSGERLNKTLKQSMIQILIKDAETMKIVFEKKIKLINVNMGEKINEAFLTPEEIKQIPSNTELKFELSYIWKSNKNEKTGVFKSHYVHFIDTYIFDRIGARIAEPVPFNDINVHRKYWHKIWEGGFSKSNRWHVEFDLKYFYLLNEKASELARLETRKMITSDNVEGAQEHPKRRKVHAKLKSGTAFGLNVLNATLTLLNQEVLDEEQLNVLRKSTFAKEFHQVARLRVEMKGKEGDTATLWSYPEIALHKLHLSKIGEVDANGQVISINSIENVIPKPDTIHFIGTKSER